MSSKFITMSDKQAYKIANDMLDVFQAIYEISPLQLSSSIENANTQTRTFMILPKKIIREISFRGPDKRLVIISKGQIDKFPENEYRLNLVYKFIRDNRYFEITLFGEPEDCGYCSMLNYYDSSTYVLCNIEEKRSNGEKKYEMAFGFDIEKGTFLELFDIIHYNTSGIIREYPNLNTPLEAELKDVVILLN